MLEKKKKSRVKSEKLYKTKFFILSFLFRIKPILLVYSTFYLFSVFITKIGTYKKLEGFSPILIKIMFGSSGILIVCTLIGLVLNILQINCIELLYQLYNFICQYDYDFSNIQVDQKIDINTILYEHSANLRLKNIDIQAILEKKDHYVKIFADPDKPYIKSIVEQRSNYDRFLPSENLIQFIALTTIVIFVGRFISDNI